MSAPAGAPVGAERGVCATVVERPAIPTPAQTDELDHWEQSHQPTLPRSSSSAVFKTV